MPSSSSPLSAAEHPRRGLAQRSRRGAGARALRRAPQLSTSASAASISASSKRNRSRSRSRAARALAQLGQRACERRDLPCAARYWSRSSGARRRRSRRGSRAGPRPGSARRCSCWPKKASRREPSAADPTPQRARPATNALVRPLAPILRPRTISVGALGQALGDLGQLGVVEQAPRQVEDPFDPRLLGAGANDLRAAPCRRSAGRASARARSCPRPSRR